MADANTKAGLATIGRELRENPPAVVNATKRKFGAARAKKQKVAIMFSKARKAGYSVPSRSR